MRGEWNPSGPTSEGMAKHQMRQLFARADYTALMLWVKSLHIVFIASWFAGLFYLPRIFVNLAMVPPESIAERERLLLMARKLFRFTTLLALPALVFGLWLWLGYGIGRGPGNGWMHAKLVVVGLSLGYHHACGRLLAKFVAQDNTRSHRWYRWFNELPVLLLLAAVILVVVKPF
jgi:putative membrane protein